MPSRSWSPTWTRRSAIASLARRTNAGSATPERTSSAGTWRRSWAGRPIRESSPESTQALSGAAVKFEAELPYRDGGTRSIEASYIPQFAADGRVAGYVGLVVDITERKSLERFRAAAAERAERLLRVTSAIANAVSDSEVFEALVDPSPPPSMHRRSGCGSWTIAAGRPPWCGRLATPTRQSSGFRRSHSTRRRRYRPWTRFD